MGHVWTAPGWQGFSSRKQQWSEPGFVVHLNADHRVITMERNGVAMQ
jgi:hypothetical protein